MTIVSKTASIAGIISCVNDVHKNAMIYSKENSARAAYNSYISCTLGAQKANRLSSKDAERKNWLSKEHFFLNTRAAIAAVTGYVKGFIRSSFNYIPNIALSAIAFCSKNKTLANVSAALLGGLELFDFIKNSTGIFQKTDYLKFK